MRFTLLSEYVSTVVCDQISSDVEIYCQDFVIIVSLHARALCHYAIL
jgi:hypothetical protein